MAFYSLVNKHIGQSYLANECLNFEVFKGSGKTI